MNNVVLDTNVLLEQTFEAVLESFTEPTTLVLPHVVLKEVDKFKQGHESKNEYSRAAIRFLDKLRLQGNLREGVAVGNHIVKIYLKEEEIDPSKPDYDIILTAKKFDAKLVSQDIHARVIADALEVDSTSFAPNDVDANKLYTGKTSFVLAPEEIDIWNRTNQLRLPDDILSNQLVYLLDEYENVIGKGIKDPNKDLVVPLERSYEAWKVKPKSNNDEQAFLMELCMNKDIDFVTAIGPSGCGKTLLALACALEQTFRRETYKKITIMRPLVAVGNDIGYLPGNKLEKLEDWMASTFDALDYLLTDYTPKDLNPNLPTKEKIYHMVESGTLELEAMTYIRGRSLPDQIIIVDDCQNMTAHEAATIITRAGEGSKVIFLGDLSPKQIDNHRLTPGSNGLSYVIDRFQGQDIVGHITMETVVRSRLAQLGVELL
ncbi:phosphate starvation-inducible protein PhoH_gp043 [Bacillus phage vB_BceM_WH1]|nr:phosphate starvation-inducible protein PhoH_gp043 [Bacillus phage vB_BceM_WH1]